MVDLTVKEDVPLLLSSAQLGRSYRAERVFKNATLACALLVAVMFAGIIWSLFDGAWPAIRAFGLGFLFTETWNPVTERFGALAPIYGTLVTSLVAMLIAVPVGIGIAIFLTELCPRAIAPANRYRRRTARRNSEHHLRRLGALRPGADPPAKPDAIPDRDV